MPAPSPATVLKLGFPVWQPGQHMTEVTIRRPKVADIIAAQRGASTPAEIEIAMVAQMDLGHDMAVQNALKTMANG